MEDGARGSFVLAVSLGHVGGNGVAVSRVEVDVHVRERVPSFAGHEPLEGVVAGVGVHVGHAQAIGDYGIRRRASPRESNAFLRGDLYHIRHNEEVVGEAQSGDRIEFMVDAPAQGRGDVSVASPRSLVHLLSQQPNGGLPTQERKAWEVGSATQRDRLDALRDVARVRYRLGAVPKDARHVAGGFQILLRVKRPLGMRFVDLRADPDAVHGITEGEVGLVDIADVVGSDDRGSDPLGEHPQPAVDNAVSGYPCALQLDVSAARE